MIGWQSEKTNPAKLDIPLLVWDGSQQAVGRKVTNSCWFVDNTYGYCEDGEIVGVTHWQELSSPPTE